MSRILPKSDNICVKFDKVEREPADQPIVPPFLKSTLYHSIQVLRLVLVFFLSFIKFL